jgi:hypothetical protein
MSWWNGYYVDERILVQLILLLNEFEYREMSWRNAYYADERILLNLGAKAPTTNFSFGGVLASSNHGVQSFSFGGVLASSNHGVQSFSFGGVLASSNHGVQSFSFGRIEFSTMESKALALDELSFQRWSPKLQLWTNLVLVQLWIWFSSKPFSLDSMRGLDSRCLLVFSFF